MLVGVIDIGTNSTRLLIAEYKDGKIKKVLTRLTSTRIGKGMGVNKEIQAKPLQKTIDCLIDYKDICQTKQVEKKFIIATSAVREARNKDKVIKLIKESTDFVVDVLSGEEEAYLSYQGAVSDLENKANCLVVDIGGGSTELIYPTLKGMQFKSVPVGAVVLTEEVFSKEVAASLIENLTNVENGKEYTLIGVGGTVTTLVAIKLQLEKYDPYLVHGQVLTLPEIRKMYSKIQSMALEERSKIKGLPKERADIIPAGMYILQTLMRKLGFSKIQISEKDLLYGLIIDRLTGHN